MKQPAVFQHKAIMIIIGQSAVEPAQSIYDATRHAWKISKGKAEQADVVPATRQGLIVEAFIPRKWLEATAANFPGHKDMPGRFGFIGELAPPDFRSRYVGKRVSDEYRKPGAANPIKYTWGGKTAGNSS